jgi:hypothetical protein
MAGGDPFPVWLSDDDIPAVFVPPPRQSRRGTYGYAKQSGDGTYLAGGMPWPWIRAARTAGLLALPVGLALWQARKYANGGAAKIHAKDRKRAGLDRYQLRRGLKQLVDAGLVRIVAGGRGRCTTVEMILDVKDAPPTSPPPS